MSIEHFNGFGYILLSSAIADNHRFELINSESKITNWRVSVPDLHLHGTYLACFYLNVILAAENQIKNLPKMQ